MEQLTRYRRRAAVNFTGIPNRVGSYEEVAKDPKVDICYVGMLHPFHFENALAALQNGKHVLVEKPSTCSESDSNELVRLVRVIDSKKSGARCTVASPTPRMFTRRKAYVFPVALEHLYFHPISRVRLKKKGCSSWKECGRASSRRWRKLKKS